MKFKHFIWSPFNLSLYVHPIVKDHDAWMNHRIKLWKEYHLKSILRQDAEVTYVTFIDPNTKEEHKNAILGHIGENWRSGKVTLRGVILENKLMFDRWFLDNLEEDVQIVITTRLDNDDVLRSDFCRKVQAYFPMTSRPFPYAVNFPMGYGYDARSGEKTEIGPEISNPFNSIFNDLTDRNTKLFKSGHAEVAASVHTYQAFESQRMWCRVIHDRNESNKLIGKKIDKVSGDFGVGL